MAEWTKQRITRLRKLYANTDLPIRSIAGMLETSVGQIYRKVRALGLDKRIPAKADPVPPRRALPTLDAPGWPTRERLMAGR